MILMCVRCGGLMFELVYLEPHVVMVCVCGKDGLFHNRHQLMHLPVALTNLDHYLDYQKSMIV